MTAHAIPRRLSINREQDAKLSRLLEKASICLEADSSLLRPLDDGTLEISCPLPPGYRPSINTFAETLRARLDKNWRLFEICESSPRISGGWSASCIPPAIYRVFLKAWTDQARPVQKLSTSPQMELFA